MNINRHIVIQAIKTSKNELIPLWDERISFEKTRDFGNVINVKGDSDRYFQVVECVYDLKTKTVEMGIEIDIYPTETEFKKDETILVEHSSRRLGEAKVVEIVYEEFDLEIKRGKKFNKWDLARVNNIEIDGNSIYAIKHWKPFYILDNGKKIKWSHELYHKV